MAKVWRMQNAEGKGPYDSMWVSDWTSRDHAPWDGHPGPYQDTGFHPIALEEFGKDTSQWRFGFSSYEQALQWFNQEELDKLGSFGFHLVELETTFVHSGDYQVIFKI